MKALMEMAFEANMELWRQNLVIYTWGNVSQADRQRGLMAIKPSGVPYDVLRAEDMVVLEIESGKQVGGDMRPSSDTPTHLVLYRAFEGIGGVTHTHSRHATAFAQAARGIPCLGTTHADYFYGEIPCARSLTQAEIEGDYEKATGDTIIETFKSRDPMACPAVLARNHGPFTWGTDGLASVENAVVLEEVARMAMMAFSIDKGALEAPLYLQQKHYFRKHGTSAYYGQQK